MLHMRVGDRKLGADAKIGDSRLELQVLLVLRNLMMWFGYMVGEQRAGRWPSPILKLNTQAAQPKPGDEHHPIPQ